MNAGRVYPGMCDGSLEIFFHQEEDKLKAIKNGRIKDFDELKKDETNFIYEIIDTDHKLKTVLENWFPNDLQFQMKQVAKCRFGGLNHLPDVTACGKVATHDYVNCSLRSNCAGENIICKPIEYNGHILTHLEIKAIQLFSTDMKNTAICQELGLPEGTFQVFRTRLYLKLGNINTKQEVTRIGVKLGIC